MRRPAVCVATFAALAALLAMLPGSARVATRQGGAWPNDWPADLEPLRGRATTIMAATGLQMTIYQIPFYSQEEFEAVWLSVLDTKSPGGTLKLLSPGAPTSWPGEANDGPTVRFLAPSGGISVGAEARDLVGPDTTFDEMMQLVEDGKALRSVYPWPQSAYLENGDLAEYVQAAKVGGKMTWVPVGADQGRRGFLHRARVDIELVVDGAVINVNRIHLPDNTRIIDQRGL